MNDEREAKTETEEQEENRNETTLNKSQNAWFMRNWN